MTAVMVVVVLAALGAFVLLLLGVSAAYDSRSARQAGDDFGAAAGVYIAPLRHSRVLADRLRSVRWNAAIVSESIMGECV